MPSSTYNTEMYFAKQHCNFVTHVCLDEIIVSKINVFLKGKFEDFEIPIFCPLSENLAEERILIHIFPILLSVLYIHINSKSTIFSFS